MAKAKALTRIRGHQIDGQPVCCTGTQLISILKVLENQLSECSWYVADISTNHPLPVIFQTNTEPTRLGNTATVITACQQCDQFLTGIFLAVPDIVTHPRWSRIFETLDEPFGDVGPAVLEIRAFDTTFFEIYSSDKERLQTLCDKFASQLVEAQGPLEDLSGNNTDVS
ncbi:hypothetical protein HYR99_22945 [Candidatus Poribacteria bacterium]|nr:hypothetical protein [Candidatus Poribacteria bacterium]